jgi:two-component system alkaline phosphatase synthesis response regulator PhoP
MKLAKILIVDDDIDILEPLQLLLEVEGYDVTTTTKGEQVFAKISSFNPNLILLDVLISGSDGRIICRRLKDAAETKKIPVIMMSAHPSAKNDSTGSGADAFIAKPFEIEDLCNLVKKYIN